LVTFLEFGRIGLAIVAGFHAVAGHLQMLLGVMVDIE
jgi:hypothetical protein